jgi:hypothetical protein
MRTTEPLRPTTAIETNTSPAVTVVHKGVADQIVPIFENNIVSELNNAIENNIVTDPNTTTVIPTVIPAKPTSTPVQQTNEVEQRYPKRSNRSTYQEASMKRHDQGYSCFDVITEDIVLNLSVKESLSEEPNEAKKAILSEFRQLIVEYKANSDSLQISNSSNTSK